MGFFQRLFRWGKSEVNSAMDSLEDPIKMADQGIKDLEADLDKSIKALAEEIRKGENVDPRINSEGKKALYDNLGRNVDFALKLYNVIDANAAVGFRTSEIRKRKLLIAIQKALVGTEFDPEKILNIVIHNPEFGN